MTLRHLATFLVLLCLLLTACGGAPIPDLEPIRITLQPGKR
jgi:hypothetical protein